MAMTDGQVGDLEPLGVLAMSAEITTYAGRDIPRWFDAAVRRDGFATSVQIRVTVGADGRLIPSGIMAFGQHSYRDAAAVLKGQPVDQLLHTMAGYARQAWVFNKFRREQGIEDGKPFTPEQQKDLERQIETLSGEPLAVTLPLPARQRRVATPDLLRDVAEVYRSAMTAGKPPTMAVASHFNVSHRTGTRWVAEARKEGFLGPAIGPTAGEAETSTASE